MTATVSAQPNNRFVQLVKENKIKVVPPTVEDGREFTVLVNGQEVLSAGAIAMLGILPSIHQVREAIDRIWQRILIEDR